MKAFVSFVICALLTACGGLSTTNILADRLMYGSLTHITVTGVNLDKGITLLAPKCTGIIELPGSTSDYREYTCTPTVTGPMSVLVLGGTTVLHTVNFDVPVPQVSMTTSMGNIVLELNPTAAPITVTNFLKYVNAGFYDGLLFHRVIPNFVVQGGGFDIGLNQVTGRAPIKLEVPNGLSNLRATVAMARTSAPDSATSEFYFNLVDNLTLDTNGGGYAVFGKVISGMETVDAIGLVTTTTRSGLSDVPETPVQMGTVTQTR